jgi:L,D-transpeptidase YcbB
MNSTVLRTEKRKTRSSTAGCKIWITNSTFRLRTNALLCSVKWYLVLTLLVCSSCYHLKERSAAIVESRESNKLPFLDTLFISRIDLHARNSVSTFYNSHQYAIVWSDTSGLLPVADSLLDIVRSSTRYGLIPTDYHLADIDSLLDIPSSTQRTLWLDAYLTDNFFSIRHHLRYGRLDSAHTARLQYIDRMDSTGVSVLSTREGQMALRSAIESQQPEFPQYNALRDSLQKILFSGISDSLTEAHIKQLAVNMERWRWMEAKPHRHIRVNIPSFMMQVMEGDSTVMESNVIVGRPETSTPVLTSVVKSFVIYPYWHVPRGIAINEILPHIKKDTLYLKSHNFQVLDKDGNVVPDSLIDWASLNKNNFPYVLRQREGSDNALGIIKFAFANNYGVYLHDTNSRRLFTKTKRALSHGCVRVHKAIPLAHYLVKDDHVYVSPQDLDQYLSLQQKVEVRVQNPIPLFIEYFTCEFKNGSVQFYEDIYKKDTQLIDVLYGTPAPQPEILIAAN